MQQSRLARLIVASALGLVILVAGLLVLQGIFVDEKRQAIAELEARRDALEQYAREALSVRLARQLDAVRTKMTSAVDDPLVAAEDYYLRRNGQQLLPRRWPNALDNGAPVTQLFNELRDERHNSVASEEDSPWAERLRLRRQFIDAIAARKPDEIESSFTSILTHRTRFIIPVTRDIPYMLALLDYFAQAGDPNPDLLRGIIRDGLRGPFGKPLAGLQRELLKRRHEFSVADLTFLAARIASLARIGRYRVDDFQRRLADTSAPLLHAPQDVSTPTVINNGTWYLEPGDEIRGFRIHLQTQVDEVTRDMRRRSLLKSDEQIAVGAVSADRQPLSSLKLSADSPHWTSSRSAVKRRFWLKSALAVLGAVLVIGIATLMVFTNRHRQRLIELKSEFLATVSHELRTPLASTRLLAETLQRRLADHPQVRDYPARIVRDVEGLSVLVENVLSFHRLENEGARLDSSTVALIDVLAFIKDEVESSVNCEVNWRFDDSCTLDLYGDPDLLKLLFLNLARNACAHNDNSHVEIAVHTANNHDHLIYFTDNAKGIAKGDWENVFDEFYRGVDSGPRGSGLGLAICKRIARRHGGDIRVHSSSPAGTTFCVRIPVRPRGKQ